jgi:uncharacterized hydrophobic protein (TIGR00271 family)
MLRLRLDVPADRADEVVEALDRRGVRRLVASPLAASAKVVVLEADVPISAGDAVVAAVKDLGIGAGDYVLVHEQVVAPSATERDRFEAPEALAWVELMGQAWANARPIGRYLALMSVAAVVAGLGVITDNAILIVGAMAVSPDLLPICATCIGVGARRLVLARRAFVTLSVGLLLVAVGGALIAVLLNLTGILAADFEIDDTGLSGLATTDYSTVLVALAAGVAAILSFETRASWAVGVAISVTTIPASAYLGVACGVGEAGRAGGALLVLVVNVTLLTLSGSLTLWVQQWQSARISGGPRSRRRG